MSSMILIFQRLPLPEDLSRLCPETTVFLIL
uniref:Uncharacterized protein n=1 Tax=Lepeophtheirus salmonis TaxID=72036 RepID=A0A0K2UHY1_LEPSM